MDGDIARKWIASAVSPLLTVIARGEARFFTKQLREMAGIGVADIERDFHHAPLRFAEQAFRLVHPQVDVVVRRRHAHGTLEQTIEVKLAQACSCRQSVKVEFFGDMLLYPVRDLP